MGVYKKVVTEDNKNAKVDDYFIKTANVGKVNVTNNVEELNINNVYTGGYVQLLQDIAEYKSKPYDFSTNLLSAATNPKDKTIMFDGKELQLDDIIAKSSIPYNKPLKKRFMNAVETDQVLARVLDMFVMFIFEVSRKSAFRPVGYYRTKTIDEFNSMLNAIIGEDIQKDLINYCDNCDTYSKVWDIYAPQAFKQSLQYGTGGFFRELMNEESIENKFLDINIPVGSPVILKHLNAFYFEKMYQHRKSFKPIFLEYTDKQYKLIDDDLFNKSDVNMNDLKDQYQGWKSLIMRGINDTDQDNKNLMIPLNQMILFRNGINTAPNLEFFGTSRIFPVLVLSELQREIHYNIMPDVNKIQSRGSGLITTKIRNDEKLKALVAELEKGSNYIVSNATDLQFQQIAINVDINALEQQRFNNVKHVLMGLNFPSPFINFEGTTNRDTVRIIAEFYKSTTLNSFKNMISNDMADQWYLPLIKFYFNNILKKAQGKKYSFIDLKLKIITEFEKVDFAVYEDKLQALNGITYITDQEKREMIGKDPYPINDDRSEGIEKIAKQIKEVDDLVKNKMPQEGEEADEDVNKEAAEIKEQVDDAKANAKQ